MRGGLVSSPDNFRAPLPGWTAARSASRLSIPPWERSSFLFLLLLTTRKAKPEAVAAVAGRAAATGRRPAVPGVEDPTAPAKHTARAAVSTDRVGDMFIRISAEPVVTPLPDVPVEIMKPPGIRLLLPNILSSTTGILVIPGVIPKTLLIVPKAPPAL